MLLVPTIQGESTVAIKYIVHTTSSLRDYNGNCYHFARITSVKTKKSLVISHVGGESNAVAILFRKDENGKALADSYEELYTVNTWEKKRDWQRMNKFANGFDGSDISGTVYEHQVTPTMIRRLNRKANPGQRNSNRNSGTTTPHRQA